jgi:hypothetical protein
MNIKEFLNKEVGNKSSNKMKIKTIILIFFGIIFFNYLRDLIF